MSVEIAPDGMYQVTPPVRLPEVLDVLIVGGGPAGTAAAFRAKELGLAALVVDYDDVMKRIRDYAKDKLILPSFGGGDKMAFPVGNSLVQRLHFDDIDKDDLCAQWRAHYCQCGIPAKIGVELTGVTAQDDGTWEARAWNHRSRADETYRARHVVIAIGRGVPRRFDIPGDTDGIAYRLDDPAHYVGHPACVIGGGTSAAEAVIAISNMKVDRQDETPVYWFYRGSRMPKVSKALSDVFFRGLRRQRQRALLPLQRARRRRPRPGPPGLPLRSHRPEGRPGPPGGDDPPGVSQAPLHRLHRRGCAGGVSAGDGPGDARAGAEPEKVHGR